ncbi:class I adenylate-forming enzyme family protein [Gimesia aquarii]|uniref:Long-chain-fatty-acid--CoA ligase n=1 Tax=Gimesia aquarii TaxID=2527964 RepID=A0A517VS94_9PLAN|nr:class I adenylate-forming enzyme family protein [Gimesia aquarii]QDT95867.1 Long-chain-fatty-acid--CoA ligase [Gimesia aquarii]
MTHLQALLKNSVRQCPTKTAIQFEGECVSYTDLEHQVRKVAGGLQKLGIHQGDRVAWFLPNCLEAVLTTLACYQIGAVAVPLNYRYVAEEVIDVVQRVDARMILFHVDKMQIVQPLLPARAGMTAVSVGSSQSTPDDVHPFSVLLETDALVSGINVEPATPAFILFTSGSTGHPKGVIHSHAGAFAGIETSRQVFEFTNEDVVLVGKPISHAGGLQTQLMPALSVGARVVLSMRPTPASAVSMIQAESVTEYGMLASDLLDFVEYLEQNPTELPTLKNSIGSGDAVPTDLHHRFRDLLGWEVMEGAGMTEIGGYYAANPRFGTRKWGSLGLPTPDTELRIVTAEGDDCPSGETGEIVLRTPSATIGYWNDEQATTDLFRGEWLHTGDLGHFDDDGYVWFIGRKKLMIVRRGSNIAPAEVESIIDEHPLVHAAVVVGLRDPRDGEVPVACVALIGKQDDSSEKTIRAYIADQLAEYKNPVHYLFFDELPRTGTGKFDRHQLQELVAEKFGE